MTTPLPLEEALAQAHLSLRTGNLVAMPTETVYGLAGDITQVEAIKKIFTLKERPSHHPLIVHVSNLETFWTCVDRAAIKAFKPILEALLHAFSPGPLTYVLPKSGTVADIVTGGQATVGIRIPSHPVAQALLQSYPNPLAAPSANKFGHISPHCANHVQEEGFPSDTVYVLEETYASNAETLPTHHTLESTIIGFTPDTSSVTILRPGSITPQRLQRVLHPLGWHVTFKGIPLDTSCLQVNVAQEADLTHAIPGHVKKHYAPKAPLYRYNSAASLVEGVTQYASSASEAYSIALIATPAMAHSVKEALDSTPLFEQVVCTYFTIEDSPMVWETMLYSTLHALNAHTITQNSLGSQVLQCVIPPYITLNTTKTKDTIDLAWLALWDRLERASVPTATFITP
ncbi:MAG: L-threonylcarbamoyladenylate synthase [Vampirovibrionales bacterium]